MKFNPTTGWMSQSVYFPEEMRAEIEAEAARLEQSTAWIVRQAWKIARKQVMAFAEAYEEAVRE